MSNSRRHQQKANGLWPSGTTTLVANAPALQSNTTPQFPSVEYYTLLPDGRCTRLMNAQSHTHNEPYEVICNSEEEEDFRKALDEHKEQALTAAGKRQAYRAEKTKARKYQSSSEVERKYDTKVNNNLLAQASSSQNSPTMKGPYSSANNIEEWRSATACALGLTHRGSSIPQTQSPAAMPGKNRVKPKPVPPYVANDTNANGEEPSEY